MKPLIFLGLLAITACVSNQEFDLDRAYASCDRYDDPSTKNRCIAEVIKKAEQERAGQAERQKQSQEDAEQRELGRVIAGAEQD